MKLVTDPPCLTRNNVLLCFKLYFSFNPGLSAVFEQYCVYQTAIKHTGLFGSQFSNPRQRERVCLTVFSSVFLDDINECECNPCTNGGTCDNFHLGFFCNCPDDRNHDELCNPM